IRYSVSTAIAPTYLLTQDGGSTRDQSDANRTEGTLVEAFVPLAVELGRLDQPSASAAPAPCAQDCSCGGTASSATDVQSRVDDAGATGDASAPASAVPQSIFLGFSATLAEEPINVLLLVDERAHDAFAPLRIEALINNRFEPLVVRDKTRALGESGI